MRISMSEAGGKASLRKMSKMISKNSPQLLYTPPMPVLHIPSVAHPQADCAWCWYTVHIERFPEDESSTICTAHQMWLLGRHRNLLSGKL